MKSNKLAGQLIVLMTAVVVMGGLVMLSRDGGRAAAAQGLSPEGTQAVAPFVLNYQGRLLDPVSGDPKPDGSYTMVFRLYTLESGGTAAWQEVKDVNVGRGTFNTLLGDVTPLSPNLFNGQALWLAIKVGADAESAPRQLVSFVGYAMYADNANKFDGLDSPAFSMDSELNAHAGVASAHHTRYTDPEAWSAVLARDNPGSSLNADLLDNYDSSSFFALNENETVNGVPRFNGGTSGSTPPFYVDSNTAVANLNADYLDGYNYSSFVNVAGDTMTGYLYTPGVRYTSPRTHYFVVGSSGFLPGSNVAYTNTYGNGGAYIASGSGAMVAPVHLPHGAVVTAMRIYFYDASSADMTVYLDAESLAGGFVQMAAVTSLGTGGYYNTTDSSISSATINNAAYSYLIYAYASSWSSNLRIKGAVITYTLSEAQ